MKRQSGLENDVELHQNLNIEFNNLGWIEDTFYKPVLKDKSFILDVNYNMMQ